MGSLHKPSWLALGLGLAWGSVSLGAVPQEQLSAASKSGLACAKAMEAALAANTSEAWKDSFIGCLGSYLQLPTINAPSKEPNEELGVEFLDAIYKHFNIPTFRLTSSEAGKPGPRASLIATLTPANAALGLGKGETYAWGSTTGRKAGAPVDKSILLMHHIDVVDVNAHQWADPSLTFSGTVQPFPAKDPAKVPEPKDAKYVWGRGALDMKGIGMEQLFAAIKLKSEKAKISKTIHLIAVADEEQNAIGSRGVVRAVTRGGVLESLMGAEVMLNEGGMGITDALGKKTLLHAIGAEEKGGSWFRLKHPQVQGMFTALAKLNLIPTTSRGYIRRTARRWKCRIESVVTPNAKTNVVPSKIDLVLYCDGAPEVAKVKESFEYRLENVVADVKQDGKRLKVTVETTSSSHGSVGLSQSALEAVGVGLARLGLVNVDSYSKPPFFRYYKTPASNEMITTIGRKHNYSYVPHLSDLSGWISWLPIIEQKGLKFLGKQLSSERLFRTSCTWTGLEINHYKSEAMLDCRLMHPAAMGLVAGQNEGYQFAKMVEKYAADPLLKHEVDSSWNFTGSDPNHPAVQVLRNELQAQWPSSAVTTFLFPAGTDSYLFRDPKSFGSEMPPVQAYGFHPAALTLELVATQHGSNERFPLSEVEPSVAVYHRVVKQIAK